MRAISHHDGPPKEKMLLIEGQEVLLQKIPSAGRLLDISGGGEGTIGRLEGLNVVAIDFRKSELLEAPDGPLKIVMDARDLQFLDETFNTITVFFTLMYLQKEDRKKVLQEIYRVLKSDGQLIIWDVIIPEQYDETKEWFVVRLQIMLPDEEIQTGYGVRWKDREQDLETYTKLRPPPVALYPGFYAFWGDFDRLTAGQLAKLQCLEKKRLEDYFQAVAGLRITFPRMILKQNR